MRSLSLVWGMSWRILLGHTLAGAVLGGIYGCAVIAASILTLDSTYAPGARAMQAVFVACVVGFAAVGWWLARLANQRQHAMLGATAGALAGAAFAGSPFLFAYLFAFPIGVALGGAYGAAAGMLHALLAASITRALFLPLSNPRLHRRTVVGAGALCSLTVPGYWLVSQARSTEYLWGRLTGSAVLDWLVYAWFPAIVICLIARSMGAWAAAWYELRAPRARTDTENVPALLRALRSSWNARLAAAGLLVAVALIGLAAGGREYRDRAVLLHVGGGEASLSPGGDLVAVLSGSRFEVRELGRGRPVRVATLPETVPAEGYKAISANAQSVATYESGLLHVYDGKNGRRLAEMRINSVDELAWSADGTTLAASTWAKTEDNPFMGTSEVLLWSRQAPQQPHTIEVPPRFHESAVALDADGGTIALAYRGNVELRDTGSGRLLRTLSPGGGRTFSTDESIAFSPDEELLAAGGWGEVSVWRMRDGALLWSEKAHEQQVLALAFSQDGRLLVSGGIDGRAHLWNAAGGGLLQTYARDEDHIGGVTSVAINPGTERVVTFEGADVRIWPKQ